MRGSPVAGGSTTSSSATRSTRASGISSSRVGRRRPVSRRESVLSDRRSGLRPPSASGDDHGAACGPEGRWHRGSPPGHQSPWLQFAVSATIVASATAGLEGRVQTTRSSHRDETGSPFREVVPVRPPPRGAGRATSGPGGTGGGVWAAGPGADGTAAGTAGTACHPTRTPWDGPSTAPPSPGTTPAAEVPSVTSR
jgi:hypothetical protein